MSDLMKATARARPWAFLSPELLADVCSRLHDAADFVRFHAVCTPWRDTPPPSMLSRHTFLPWLVSRFYGRILHSPVKYFGGHISSQPQDRCNSILLQQPDGRSSCSDDDDDDDTNWVGSADGSSAWIFTGGPHEPALFDAVTGALHPLPPFSDDDEDQVWRSMSNPRGIVYRDGTIFLYSFVSDSARHKTVFAVLRPGDTAWTVVEAGLDLRPVYHSCAAYHGGKVLVWVGAYFWCAVTPVFGAAAGCLETTTWDRLEDEYYTRDHSYVLESQGELLWASILVQRKIRRHDHCAGVLMRVHALEEEEEEEADGGGKMRWVERDDRSLSDRVLFLGSPTSFAMNATERGMDGACAYFVLKNHMFRYSFIDNEAKPVEWLCPAGRPSSEKTHLWLRPNQPGIATIQEIQDRLQTRNKKQELSIRPV